MPAPLRPTSKGDSIVRLGRPDIVLATKSSRTVPSLQPPHGATPDPGSACRTHSPQSGLVSPPIGCHSSRCRWTRPASTGEPPGTFGAPQPFRDAPRNRGGTLTRYGGDRAAASVDLARDRRQGPLRGRVGPRSGHNRSRRVARARAAQIASLPPSRPCLRGLPCQGPPN